MSRRRAGLARGSALSVETSIPAQRDAPEETISSQDATGPHAECPICSEPLPRGRTLHDPDVRRLDVTLRAVPSVLADLDDATTRLTTSWREPGTIRGRATSGCRPGCDHTPDNPSCTEGVTLDLDTHAADVADRIRKTLTRAGRTWADEQPGPLTLAAWRNIGWTLHGPVRIALRLPRDLTGTRPWEAALAATLIPAIRDADRACGDRPPRVHAGDCPRCGTVLHAIEGETTATCPACGRTQNVARGRDTALDRAGHITGTATQLAHILGPPTTPAMIRDRAHRQVLAAVGVDPAGHPTYRLDATRRALGR